MMCSSLFLVNLSTCTCTLIFLVNSKLNCLSSTRHWYIGWTVVHSTLVYWLDRRPLNTGTLSVTFFSSESNTCCCRLDTGTLAGPSSTRHWYIGWTVVDCPRFNSTLSHSSRQSQTLVFVHSTLVHWLDRRPLDTGTLAGPLWSVHVVNSTLLYSSRHV